MGTEVLRGSLKEFWVGADMLVSDELAFKAGCFLFGFFLVFFTSFFICDRMFSHVYSGDFGGVECTNIDSKRNDMCDLFISGNKYFISEAAEKLNGAIGVVEIKVGYFSDLVYMVDGGGIYYSHANIFLILAGIIAVILLFVASIYDGMDWIKFVAAAIIFKIIAVYVF